MQSSGIPSRIATPFASSAVAPYIRPIPVQSQVGITPGAASYTDGFPPVTFVPESSGGTPPSGQDFNGIFNIITKWIRWLNAGAPVFYDATFALAVGGYPKGALLAAAANNSTFWLSTAENNLNNPDAGVTTNWALIVPASPSTVNPIIDGVAAPGVSLAFARADHVHPTDSSRAALSYVNSTFETITAAAATFLTKINPVSNGTFNHAGNLNVAGDINATRSAGPSGVIYLGNTGARYLYYDGANYVMPGAELYVNGQAVAGGIQAAAQAAAAAQTSANNAQTTGTNAGNAAAAAQNSANNALVQMLGSTFPFGGGYNDVTSIRAFNTTYNNTFGRIMGVYVETISTSGSQTAQAFVNGAKAANLTAVGGTSRGSIFFVVPIGINYQINIASNMILTTWLELR